MGAGVDETDGDEGLLALVRVDVQVHCVANNQLHPHHSSVLRADS